MLGSTAPRSRCAICAGAMLTACLSTAMLVLALLPGAGSALAADLIAGEPPATAGLRMSNTSAGLVCQSADERFQAASCSSIDAFGAAPAVGPGRSRETTMVFTNTGSIPATSFAVDAGACSQVSTGRTGGSATDLCDLFTVKLTVPGATVFEGSVAEFGRTGPIEILDRAGVGLLTGGQSIAVTLTLQLSDRADNRYQGLRIAAPISWTFGG